LNTTSDLGGNIFLFGSGVSFFLATIFTLYDIVIAKSYISFLKILVLGLAFCAMTQTKDIVADFLCLPEAYAIGLLDWRVKPQVYLKCL
jgi:hypothetical protein